MAKKKLKQVIKFDKHPNLILQEISNNYISYLEKHIVPHITNTIKQLNPISVITKISDDFVLNVFVFFDKLPKNSSKISLMLESKIHNEALKFGVKVVADVFFLQREDLQAMQIVEHAIDVMNKAEGLRKIFLLTFFRKDIKRIIDN